MDIIITNSSDSPIYEQITSQIKNLILNGTLNEGDALPSMRTLAKELRVSVITTKRAYEELDREGFIQSFTGKGSFVCEKNTKLIKEEQLRRIEEILTSAILLSKSSGIALDEVKDLFNLLCDEL